MFDFLFHMTDIDLFILLGVFFVCLSIVSVCLITRYVPSELRYQNNPVIGYMSSIVGIIYGVLVGLTALYLFNNISYTTDAVAREANAVADIYRDSRWLKEPVRSNVQVQINKYLDRVINVEWPLMEHGQTIDDGSALIIENISDSIESYGTVSNTEFLVLHDLLDEIKALYDSRQQRIEMSYTELSIEVWEVIIFGSFLTLAINFLFGMHFSLHIITTSAIGLMIAAMIFLLVTVDRPFQGEFVVEPDQLLQVQARIAKDIKKSQPPLTIAAPLDKKMI